MDKALLEVKPPVCIGAVTEAFRCTLPMARLFSKIDMLKWK